MRAAQEAQEAEDNRLIEGEEEEEEEGGESAKVLRFTGPGRILQKSSASGFAESSSGCARLCAFLEHKSTSGFAEGVFVAQHPRASCPDARAEGGYSGTSLIRKHPLPGLYRRPVPRVIGES